MAAEAHQLVCAYAPRLLDRRARSGWQQDAAEFSTWLAEFDAICHAQGLVSAARLPLELTELFEKEPDVRPPLLLAGFDRILPTQRKLFAAWNTGGVREVSRNEPASNVRFHEAADPARELAACARWCGQQLAANPEARLLIVAQGVSKRRGEFERAFLRGTSGNGNSAAATNLFEFSLGVPLGQIALARSAGLLLRWLNGSLEEHELDWLLSIGHATANSNETLALTSFVRTIRRKGWQRTHWTVSDFLRQKPGEELPAAWVARVTQAQHRLLDSAHGTQTPLAWAELVPQLLQLAGWPGARPLSSVEFQVHRRWQQAVDDCASLGFDGRSINWNEFLADLDRAVGEVLFAPESQGAPILIAGPAESAGLTADAVWFVGANEDAWPSRGATHPLLPIAVQREFGMPHATPQVDWDLAQAMTSRLLASASVVHFSYARQSEGVDTRPSRLIARLAGAPQPMPAELSADSTASPITVSFDDSIPVPFPPGPATGGSGILTAQSRCAFKAFATARLGAEKWDAAKAGLTAPERGLLLHEVMHRIWAGPPDGIRSHAELVARTDLESFVANHVRRVLREKTPARAHDSMPPRYLELEGERLATLVTEWLRYEQTRLPFTVLETELVSSPTIAGLTLRLRLDRVDGLNDGSLLVIDYKTGDVSAKSWDLPRPDDVQLPLYAGFTFNPQAQELGGLVFAKLRAGDNCFEGRVKAAKQTLQAKLRANTNLVSKPLNPEDMAAWRKEIESLAQDFLAGRADVNPRDYPKTCEHCGLQALCRIQEIKEDLESATGTESQEGADE
jgi:ATP-dependent helicase/nuclease subunit B